MLEYAAWLKGLPHKPVFDAYRAGFDFTFVYWYLMRICRSRECAIPVKVPKDRDAALNFGLTYTCQKVHVRLLREPYPVKGFVRIAGENTAYHKINSPIAPTFIPDMLVVFP